MTDKELKNKLLFLKEIEKLVERLEKIQKKKNHSSHEIRFINSYAGCGKCSSSGC